MARAGSRDLLADYKAKRDFAKTPEPGPKRGKAKGNSFVIQKHAARRTHFDFRLEHDGVLKSWAVTRGPSLDPAQKRLAVMTEDHPLEYGGFEGVIPKGEYGGGPVMIWDEGTWEPIGDPDEGLAKGDLKFRLHGHRLNGDYVLVRMKPRKEDRGRQNWLLDQEARRLCRRGQRADRRVRHQREVRPYHGPDPQWRLGHLDLQQGSKKNSSRQARGNGKAQAKKVARALIPPFVEPELATLDTEVPTGRNWLHEVKYDGYRIIARKAGDDITLFSRSGLDWTVRFPAIAQALLTLPTDIALIDGEVAFVLPSGITDFKSLQEHIDTPNHAIRYFVFDLLNLDGTDRRKKPLKERRAQLAKLLAAKGVSDFLIYADYVEGSGPEFYAQACAAGLEGIVSKRADRPYISGRGKDWLKIKCSRGEEFVIGGYSRSDVKGKPFSSLLLGTFEDGKLSYSGKVGTGFDAADFDRLAGKFKPLERASSPFVEVPREERKGAVWLEPKLVAQIAFTERTRDGRLRHPSFKGLREDKPARDVHREERDGEEAGMAKTSVASSKTGGDATFEGITLTNPGKVYYPDIGLTKLDVARYYETVAPYMLPYVARRPISLVRCPEGIDKEHFFQRHAMKGMSKAIKEVPIAGGESKKKYLYIDDATGLFGLVQIGTLEIHDWGVSLDHINEPDRLVFDLDPDEGLPLPTLKAAVVEVREFLDDLGFKSFLKSTGGKGFHLVAPIAPKLGWAEIKPFAKAIADALVSARPDRYTANPLKRTREGKIFVDYLRNQRGGSAIVNYSTRAKAGAPVACPLRWDELKGLKAASPYTAKTLPARLRSLKRDPWEGFFSTRQSITAKARKALGLG